MVKPSRKRNSNSQSPDSVPRNAGSDVPSPAPRQEQKVSISPSDRIALYAASRCLPVDLRKKFGLRIPFVTYFQDPSFTKLHPKLDFDETLYVDWEPGFADGPTSARFAVVDYDADLRRLTAPAQWDSVQNAFIVDGKRLDKQAAAQHQFHQVSVWALLQRALAFFEEGNGLGRRIPWAFEGNRLIVVPHAGYGQNAYYDRHSKSIQFYYFQGEAGIVYTCLSTDIVHHEFGHAVLDGVRPYYHLSNSVETAAFHEFVGDLTAILLALRNNEFRKLIADETSGKMSEATGLSFIAEEFGNQVLNNPYLRSAKNDFTMARITAEASAHDVSQVLTGAMFSILERLADRYRDEDDETETADATVKASSTTHYSAFWHAAERMQRMAIQPLDFLPPVEVTFRDYAVAVCRAQQLSNPLDPHNYYGMLVDVFRERQILSEADEKSLRRPQQYLYDRLGLRVFHGIDSISRSRSAAYRFIDDNRAELLIPADCDFFVADLYEATKLDRQSARQLRQIILQYVWREAVLLVGGKFGKYDGRSTALLCGGTLAFDDNGNVLSWMRKPGSRPFSGQRKLSNNLTTSWNEAIAEGSNRRQTLLNRLEDNIRNGNVGAIVGSEKGLLGTHLPPVIASEDEGLLVFRLSPHLHLCGNNSHGHGAAQWEIIS